MTIYSFARNFQSVPVSLIGIAIALVAFSELSRVSGQREFWRIVKEKSFRILLATGLAALGLAVFSKVIIGFFLGGGAFTQEAVNLTAAMLVIYCFSVPLESLMHLLARAHYALKDTLRPSVIHVATIGLTIGLSAWLVDSIGIFAIPVSFGIGLLVQVGLLVVSLGMGHRVSR